MATTEAPALNPVATRRRLRAGTIVVAVTVQAAVLFLATYIIVAKPWQRTEPEFIAKKTIYLPQRELEHRVAVAEFAQAAAKPLPLEKLTTSALLPPDLPALPTVPRTDFNPLENTEFLARDAQALLAQSGLSGAMAGLKTAASTAAFFGVEDSGTRIVIIVNTSVSVRNKAQRRGVSWEKIQDEVCNVVDQLDAGTQFAIVQFSQAVRVFPEFLAPATATNRSVARTWVKANLRGNPPITDDMTWFGHEAAFEAAFRLEPDVIFLVTDGVLDRREVRDGRTSYPQISYDTLLGSIHSFQRGVARDAHINVIGFEMKPSDATHMRELAREYRGHVREF